MTLATPVSVFSGWEEDSRLNAIIYTHQAKQNVALLLLQDSVLKLVLIRSNHRIVVSVSCDWMNAIKLSILCTK